MAFDYTKTSSTALRLITKFGQSGSLVRVVGGTYDPSTGATSGESERIEEIKYAELPKLTDITNTGYLNQYQEDIVKGKVRFMLIAAKGVSSSPESGDLFRDRFRVDWEILGSTQVSPAGIDIVYKAGVRKK